MCNQQKHHIYAPAVFFFRWKVEKSDCGLSFGHGLTSKSNNGKPFFASIFYVLLNFVVQLKKVKFFEEKKWVAQEKKNIKIESEETKSLCRISFYKKLQIFIF